ncbi:MAG: PorT family protein [Tannerella sp.]|nr:PorT family protein [Tannerella sp.]
MKLKTYIIILSFAMMTFDITAQIIITTPYEFFAGVSGGTTFSSVTFNPRVPQETLSGSTLGLTGRMTMGKNVGLQLELNYVQQGWNEVYEAMPEYRYSRRLDYLQLPFYTHVRFGGKKVNGFIHAGPQIGYLLGESTTESQGENKPGGINTQHDMSVENKLEWGISGGVGIEIRTGIGCFSLEGRYYYSFGDIYSTQRKDYFSKASSQVISAKITYLIPFRQR